MSKSKKVKWFKSTFNQENNNKDENSPPAKIQRKIDEISDSVETILFDDDDDDLLLSLPESALTTSSSLPSTSASNPSTSIAATKSPEPSISSAPEKPILSLQLSSSSSSSKNKTWLDLFEPQSIDDLTVHPKKITEVQDWLKHYENIKNKYPAQMLLLTGPTGSGKTATLRILTKLMNYELIEWINPVDMDTFECNSSCTFDRCSHKESQITIFRKFLFRSSRYQSLFVTSDRRLILVEDFPNAFLRDPGEFHTTLNDYTTYGRSPLVFIVTDSRQRNLNIAHNLFPEHIQSQYNIGEISFNPISTTLMKKCLKRINTKLKENFPKSTNFIKIPTDDVLDDIVLTANGDIRNAILNLQLICMKGSTEFRKEIKTTTSRNKRKVKNKKLSSIGRDETISTMHALGRVMYPKYYPDNPSKLVHSPEEIADLFTSEAKTFLNLIHANYLSHYKCVEDISNAANDISLSDIFMNEFNTEMDFSNIGLCLSVRSVMIHNTNLSNNFALIKGVHKKNEKNCLSTKHETYRRAENITNNVFTTDYSTFLKIIKKS